MDKTKKIEQSGGERGRGRGRDGQSGEKRKEGGQIEKNVML